MTKEILVSIDQDEIRAAVLEDGVLVEIYIERASAARVVGNIYKGRVENVLPGMEAAFVSIGLERNAFLYVSDALAPRGEDNEEIVPPPRTRNIKDLLRPGQELILQITKEPIGTKGARVTSHATLPGRYCVLMPTVEYVGVSRRIEDPAERDRLRKLADKLRPPDTGIIIRTAAEGRSDAEIAGDIRFLSHLWTRIGNRARTSSAPALLHRDLGLTFRMVRDHFTEDVTRFIVDSKQEYDRVMELLDEMSPNLKSRVSIFESRDRSLFDTYGVEQEIEKASRKKVWLRSGGYIIIDQTEALTVIDVNTGKFVGSTNLEDTVLRNNLEAAYEIARQLRLRDIGGIIIADFIDMESPEHRHRVVHTLNEAVKRDRTKTHILGLTQLGLVEMTRKKVREGLEDVLTKPCPYCEGRGKVLAEETMAGRVRRQIKDVLRNSDSEAVLIEVHPSVASLVIGPSGNNLKDLEKELGRSIFVRGAEDCHIEEIRVRGLGPREEVETKALPVRVGQTLDVRVEEPHVSNLWDGVARLDGYVIDVAGGGSHVNETVRVEVEKVYRTYAKARIV